MTPNKRDLKAYSRFDGTGRIVPGSTVLRRNKPKNGNWKEVQAYECCNSGGTFIYVTDFMQENLFTDEFFGTLVSFICYDVLPEFTSSTSGTSFFNESSSGTFTFSNWDDVINFLNLNFSTVGVFSYLGGTNVQVIINPNISQYINCSNPSFTIEFSTP